MSVMSLKCSEREGAERDLCWYVTARRELGGMTNLYVWV
jgi:hypothetical protein